MKLKSANLEQGLHRIRKNFSWIVLLFGLFNVVGFYWLLFHRCTSRKELKCYIPELLQADQYIFVACRLPEDVRLWPSVGNGHISMVAYSQNVSMNGLYNGFMNASHRAAIPCPLLANVTGINNSEAVNRTYVLNTKAGVYQELIFVNGANVTLEWYAHRTILPLLVFQVSIQRTHATSYPLHINLDVRQWGASHDLDFSHESSWSYSNISIRHGRTKQPETGTSGHQEVYIIFDYISPVLTLDSGEQYHRWTFLASIHVNLSHANQTFSQGLQLSQSGQLQRLHTDAWSSLWHHGRIDVDGDLQLARTVSASQYYILSSVPDSDDPRWPFVGLSPSGLAWGDDKNYQGRIFWDQETWMYPPLLMMHAEMGSRLLATRFRTIAAARNNAKRTGYRGLRYPWASAFTGLETSPSETYATQEVHINGDISFAMQQYLLATGNTEILNTSLFKKTVFGIADFWISRLQYNKTRQLFDINVVMPPDEYAYNVNNSAFTNMIAAQSLLFAAKVARMCRLPKRANNYRYYAERIYIPFNDTVGYHPEYDSYAVGSTIKQADVILMGFPFMWNMTVATRRKDLEIYGSVTSIKGPAMSDSMYAIGWLEMKEFDRAYADFKQMFKHVAGAFQVWTENKRRDGATNFITGMGGFLQALLFGYGGIRLRDKSLDFDPVLPPGCSQMRFTGIDYMGSSLSLTVVDRNMTIGLTSSGRFPLRLLVESKSTVLVLDQPITVNRTKAHITAVQQNKYLYTFPQML